MQFRRSQGAFTLIEMVVTVSVLAILAAIAVPSFLNTLEKRRVVGAAEQLYADLQYARTEAIKGNRWVTITFRNVGTGTNWCYGIDQNFADDCNCDDAATCTVDGVQKVFSNSGFRGVSITSTTFNGVATVAGFEPRRGIPRRPNNSVANGTVIFSSNSGQLNVVVSLEGRIRLCSPSSPPLSGYPACS